jgi:hypothetical protein
MTSNNIKVTPLSMGDIDLKLEHTPSDSETPIISQVGDVIVAGYLVNDEYCENPLKSSEGQGFIYTNNRKLNNYNQEAIYAALGYDNYGDQNYELLDGSRERELYIEKASTQPDAHEKFSEKFKNMYYSGHVDGESLEEFLVAAAEQDYDVQDVVFADILSEIQQTLWKEGRANGTIGDPYAIDVNYMEHVSSSYSAQAPGQSPLEIDNVDALWLPDDIATGNIEAQAIQSLLPSGTKIDIVSIDATQEDIAFTYTLPDGNKQEGFKSFIEAGLAAAKELGIDITQQQLIDAGRDFAYDYAKGVCDEYTKYTSWCNGENYGVVVETFQRESSDAWKQIEIDSCLGYVGTEYANKALQKAVDLQIINVNETLLTTKEDTKPVVGSALSGEQLTALKTAALKNPNHDVNHDQDYEAE